jgi:hypothetical protein
MSIVSDITSVIGLVQKAKQLADQLANLELKEIIVDLQGKVLDLKQEINSLREENEGLKRQIKEAPVAAATPKEVPTIRDGMYWKGDDGPFCTACYDTSERLVRASNATHDEKVVMGIRYKCPVCKANYAR